SCSSDMASSSRSRWRSGAARGVPTGRARRAPDASPEGILRYEPGSGLTPELHVPAPPWLKRIALALRSCAGTPPDPPFARGGVGRYQATLILTPSDLY